RRSAHCVSASSRFPGGTLACAVAGALDRAHGANLLADSRRAQWSGAFAVCAHAWNFDSRSSLELRIYQRCIWEKMHETPANIASAASAYGSEMMSSALPLVSVIIPVYNDREGLEKCLGCLARQTEPASHFEVIVIDNGSDIPIEPATALPNLKVIRESRPGSYAARNRGLELACGSLVAFTDADCLPRPDWIARGIAVLEEFRQPVSIGGRINIVPQFPSRPRAVELYEQALVMVQSDLVSGYGFAATANMWTTRQTFDAVG